MEKDIVSGWFRLLGFVSVNGWNNAIYLILLELSSANFGLTRSSPNVIYNLTIQNTAAFRTIDCVSSVRCISIEKRNEWIN